MDLVPQVHLAICAVANAVGSDTTHSTLQHGTVRLCTADIAYDINTTLADINSNSPTYQGYADGTATFAAPNLSADGVVESLGSVHEFRPTGSDSPNTIFGLGFILGDGSLGFTGRFDNAPIPMVDTTSVIQLTLRYRPEQDGIVSVID